MRFRSRRDAAKGSPPPPDRIAADLERLGVAAELRDELARRLEIATRGLSSDGYDAALAGVALAHGLHVQREQALRRSVRDLGEIQRLLGVFSEEMRKLDEALQILTAYVHRLRARTAARAPDRTRTVH